MSFKANHSFGVPSLVSILLVLELLPVLSQDVQPKGRQRLLVVVADWDSGNFFLLS